MKFDISMFLSTTINLFIIFIYRLKFIFVVCLVYAASMKITALIRGNDFYFIYALVGGFAIVCGSLFFISVVSVTIFFITPKGRSLMHEQNYDFKTASKIITDFFGFRK